jgi:hypothetical protein
MPSPRTRRLVRRFLAGLTALVPPPTPPPTPPPPAAWIALSLWTGLTFVGYFTPIRELVPNAFSLSLGPWEAFWVLFYGFATYGNAGWLREQVCKYMCPYARFQSAMFDRNTLLIGLPLAQLIRHKPETYGEAPDGGHAEPAFDADGAPVQRRVNFTAREALRAPAFWFISFGHAFALLTVSAVMVHLVPHEWLSQACSSTIFQYEFFTVTFPSRKVKWSQP